MFSNKFPLLIIAYNRHLKVKKLIKSLKKIRPNKIYFFVDGPKNSKDQIFCEKTKKMINEINWKCEITKNFEKKNNGVGIASYKAVSWFFENEKSGIILEDDCIPNKHFFYFCEKMLIHYQYNKKIGIICGTNFVPMQNMQSSYFFSKYPNIWGWATWKRNWSGYNLNLKYWKKFRISKKWYNLCEDFNVYKSFTSLIDYYYFNKKKLWDVQYFLYLMKRNKINILPKKSLVKNIGMDKQASHTFKKFDNYDYTIGSIDYDLKHPKEIKINKSIDKKIFYKIFYKKRNIFIEFLKHLKFIILSIIKIFKTNV